uniref:Uncharacterized protein n=1 Tax=Physcomitrium patens TaxID=3218 RepID=A0A2K1K3T1_PHYPA|nr:hypothetical protein PHYPA_012911 [Physcomitrium patens]
MLDHATFHGSPCWLRQPAASHCESGKIKTVVYIIKLVDFGVTETVRVRFDSSPPLDVAEFLRQQQIIISYQGQKTLWFPYCLKT